MIQRPGDPGHGVVGADAQRVVVELFLEIAGVQARQSGRSPAVAAAVQAVTGEAGVRRPAGAAAHGDDVAAGREGAIRPSGRGIAGGEQGRHA
nr:hypothetical protein [Brevundimonas sp.]